MYNKLKTKNHHIFIILLFYLILYLPLYSADSKIVIPSDFYDKLPENKVYTFSEFTGNYAIEFKSELLSQIRAKKNIDFVDYDIHKKVLDENIRYSEPVFDNKYASMPNLTSPDISIYGSANLQKKGILFKRRQHLDYSIIVAETATGLNIVNINERIIFNYNPPILLLMIIIISILALTRWIIHLKRGYKTKKIIIAAMAVITLVVIWYFL